MKSSITEKLSRLAQAQTLLDEIKQIDEAVEALQKQAAEIAVSTTPWKIRISFENLGAAPVEEVTNNPLQGWADDFERATGGMWRVNFPNAQSKKSGVKRVKYAGNVGVALRVISLLLETHDARRQQLLRQIEKL